MLLSRCGSFNPFLLRPRRRDYFLSHYIVANRSTNFEIISPDNEVQSHNSLLPIVVNGIRLIAVSWLYRFRTVLLPFIFWFSPLFLSLSLIVSQSTHLLINQVIYNQIDIIKSKCSFQNFKHCTETMSILFILLRNLNNLS